jgi:NAD(P)-dependent dehydrogenase (short-subunit alcohol dehydrogenase family)
VTESSSTRPLMLAGRTIVVTGAARGVGRAIAEACGRHGAKLILGDILGDEGEKTVAALRQAGLDARFSPLDLAEPGSIEAFAQDIAGREGTIHGLVNNAAITNSGGPSFDALEIAAWDRVMQVNVRGTWIMTRAMAPLLLAGGTGRIVNLASDTALWGPPRLLAYVTS